MNNRAYRIANALLLASQKEYLRRNRSIPEIKVFWHNTVFLFFSEVNRRKLFSHGEDYDFEKMVSIGLMPEYLFEFYMENQSVLNDSLAIAIDEYLDDPFNVNECRQELLNAEIDFTGNEPVLFADKVSRDNIGSYYTPRDLASAVVNSSLREFVFSKKQNYRIADFSCGGGDFFLAIMNYVNQKYGIANSDIVKWFFGVDIDPIALQICVTNLLEYAHREDWAEIISHFQFGNPLIIFEGTTSAKEKNQRFAEQRLYAPELGLPAAYFEDTYDVVVGNPPWEKIRFEERKFFRGINNTIAAISQKNLRDAEVEKLRSTNPKVYQWRNAVCVEYSNMTAAKYHHNKIKDAIVGELNTYSLFTELGYNMLSANGCLALIVKSTLVTAPVYQRLWSKFLSDKAIKAISLFENKDRIFCIDSRERFVVFIASKNESDSFRFSAGLTRAEMLETSEYVMLSADDLAKINPFSNTIPNVSNIKEIAFLKQTHERFGLFSTVHPKCHFGRLVHLTAHASFIDTSETEDNVPIYEGKFIEQYDARYATFKGLSDNKKYASKASATKIPEVPNGFKEIPECRYFVRKELWNKYQNQYNQEYSLCWRSLTSPTNRRTMLAMILPTCPTCQSIQMLQTPDKEELVLLLALFNSIPFDYFVRIKMPGLDLTQSVIKQIPVPSEIDYERTIAVGNITATLKKHILSYAVSLLKDEGRLKELTDKLAGTVYVVTGMSKEEKQKMIDLLFKEAYHLDDATFKEILRTFPKY